MMTPADQHAYKRLRTELERRAFRRKLAEQATTTDPAEPQFASPRESVLWGARDLLEQFASGRDSMMGYPAGQFDLAAALRRLEWQ